MLEQYTKFDFSFAGTTRPVFTAGDGPPVIVMHEIPGITPQVAAFAERTVDSGFRVFLPEFLGTTGKAISNRYLAQEMVKVCINKEFHVLAAGSSSPITTWIRGLSRYIHDEFDADRVGAIGMCLTGNFALALMVDPWIKAPVLSQPSLPFSTTPASRRALHLSDADLTTVKTRVAQEDQDVLGMRFTKDPLCPPQRFDRLREEFGSNFEGIEIDSSKDNPHGYPKAAHSVVTTEWADKDGFPTAAASARVLEFFHENLDAPSAQDVGAEGTDPA